MPVAEGGDRPVPGVQWIVCSRCGGVTGGRVEKRRANWIGTGVPAPSGDYKLGVKCSCGSFQWWDAVPSGTRVRDRRGAR